MSIEVVLLFFAFLLLPLVHYLVRAALGEHEAAPAQPAGPRSSGGVPPLREQPFPATEDRPLTDLAVTLERKPARRSDGPPAPPTRRRGTAVVGLRDALDLRRAIVLRTVLGPCRASRPPDWPDGAARR